MSKSVAYFGDLPEVSTSSLDPWSAAFGRELQSLAAPLAERQCGNFTLGVYVGNLALWILVQGPSGGRTAFRAAFVPEGGCIVSKETDEQNRLEFRVGSPTGEQRVAIDIDAESGNGQGFHWRTTLTPAFDLKIPFYPRDIFPMDEEGKMVKGRGLLHTPEQKANAGTLFFTQTHPASGSFLYLQDFTPLNDYFEKTRTSPTGTVGGEWPQLGFALPPAADAPLPGNRPTVIADAYVLMSTGLPDNDRQAARLFLDLYAALYMRLPKPGTIHRDWSRRIDATVRDLTHSPACSVRIGDGRYLWAYVGADDRPPESMVQLAVLVPMDEFARASGVTIPLIDELKAGIPAFFKPELETVVRWLPAKERMLDEQEEHMKPQIMDSWYLHHICLNLSRLALAGDESARPLFLDTLSYCIRAARHFRYRWPVFYDMETLEAVKAETAPGEGGEHDVPAQYAHLMFQAWDLTGDRSYIDEAATAARTLQGLGFRLGYQFNNTSFGAKAWLRLWRETGDELFRDLSYVCLANIFRNVWLWQCGYGNGRYYHTFMGVTPLQDAPYLALFEELEILAAFHEYLHIGGDDIPASLRILLPEFCKYLIDRAWYYYPSEIPEEILADKVKSGHINRHLSIPLEDIYEGWHSAGEVGQEIYGAAAPFVFCTRHMRIIEGANFTLHCDYPIADVEVDGNRKEAGKKERLSFRLLGDGSCSATVRLLPNNYTAMPATVLCIDRGHGPRPVKGKLSEFGYPEYAVPGDARITVEWGVRRKNGTALKTPAERTSTKEETAADNNGKEKKGTKHGTATANGRHRTSRKSRPRKT